MMRAQLPCALLLAALAAGCRAEPAPAPLAPVDYWSQELRSEDPSARRAAAHGLGLAGSEARAALPALRRTAEEDPDPDVRATALRAVRSIEAPVGEASEPAPRAARSKADPAARTSWREAYPPLDEELAEPEAYAEASRGTEGAAPPPGEAGADRADSDGSAPQPLPSGEIRRGPAEPSAGDAEAAWSRSPEVRPAAEALEGRLASGSPEERVEAAEELLLHGERHRALDALASALRDGDPDVRQRAALALGSAGPGEGAEAVVPDLLRALGDSDELVRASAAEALGLLGAESALPSLRAAERDSSELVRAMAAAAVDSLEASPADPYAGVQESRAEDPY